MKTLIALGLVVLSASAASTSARASDEWNQQLFSLPAIKLQERTKRIGSAVAALYLTIVNQVGRTAQVVLADRSGQTVYCTDVESCRRDVPKKDGEIEIRKATCSKVEVAGDDIELVCKITGDDGREHTLEADESSYELD